METLFYNNACFPFAIQLSKLLALSQLGQTKMSAQSSIDKSDILYGPVTVEDTDAVIRMLKESFFKVVAGQPFSIITCNSELIILPFC